MSRTLMRRFSLVSLVAAAVLIANASPAAASVTIGQLAPETVSLACRGSVDRVQPTVTSGNTYVVPGKGTIISWSHNARAEAGQMLTMKIFHKFGQPALYRVIHHDGPRPLAAGLINTFPTNIPVNPGEVLGLYTPGPANTACVFSAPEDSHLFRSGNLADGEAGAFEFGAGSRVNVSAVFNPSNSFTLVGKVKLNKKKGTARLTADVPNPGSLTLSGKGLKRASAAVNAPGTAKLLIRAKGKKKKKLNRTGTVKVKPIITYTPTGGDPSTQSRKLKLKKEAP
jgi:hypothetical protein